MFVKKFCYQTRSDKADLLGSTAFGKRKKILKVPKIWTKNQNPSGSSLDEVLTRDYLSLNAEWLSPVQLGNLNQF